MNVTTLEKITQGADWIGLGLAGNQAGHLEQAGEDSDFTNVKSEENAPKGIFPWYVPAADGFLATYPLSHEQVSLQDETRLQPEPEIGLVVEFSYTDTGAVQSLSVKGFSAFNDCSKRIPADKISHKKNWGAASKGLAQEIITVDDFDSPGGLIDQYRLTCYLVRDGALIQYGEDTAVTSYCYLNSQLTNWIVAQINTQEDFGPLEDVSHHFSRLQPRYGVIGIGATCYTDFGNSEERFLQAGDSVLMAVYDPTRHTSAEVESILSSSSQTEQDGSLVILRQKS